MDHNSVSFKLNPVDLLELKALRDEYIRTLPEFQELYLELMLANASCYSLYAGQYLIGYAIATSENVLIEFFLVDGYLPQCKDIFEFVLKELPIKSIYCKSFDFLLLNCCLLKSMSYKLIGAHYRNFSNAEVKIFSNLTYRLAKEEDIPFLLMQEDGLYETQDELIVFVKGQNISMFYEGNNFVGCGFMIRVHPNWDYYDIGMWVHLLYRKKGFATQIISILKETCLKNNWKPICGCDINNIASQKTLEKNGFVSKYKLIEFSVSIS